MEQDILCAAVDDGVLVLTLNRPDKLNAWTYALHARLRLAIEAANADPQIDAIVITAEGKGFCAGADMSAVFGLSAEAKQQARDAAQTQHWVALLRSSKPVLAAVNGAAIGIGASLILAMDQILAGPQAKFSLRFVQMGLVPELGASHFAQRRMGFGQTSRLLLTGETLDAEAALAVGLIDQVLPAEELLPQAKALARRMGRNPHAALRAIKALITDNADDTDLDRVQQRELEALIRCYASAEHREAVAAFMEKRAPDFAQARAG